MDIHVPLSYGISTLRLLERVRIPFHVEAEQALRLNAKGSAV